MVKLGCSVTPSGLPGSVTGTRVGMGVWPLGRPDCGAQAEKKRIRASTSGSRRLWRVSIPHSLGRGQRTDVIHNVPSLAWRQVFGQGWHLAEALGNGQKHGTVELA